MIFNNNQQDHQSWSSLLISMINNKSSHLVIMIHDHQSSFINLFNQSSAIISINQSSPWSRLIINQDHQSSTSSLYWYFELLIDTIAEICQFQNLTYFVSWWCHRWCHKCLKHNLTSPNIYQQNIVSVAPVLYSYLVRTNIVTNIDRQTDRQTHTHTNTLGENIITWLMWVMTKFTMQLVLGM